MGQAPFFCSVEDYARFLWEAGIVQVRTGPPWFRWASGIESPIYADHRRLLGYPAWRRRVVEMLAENVRRRVAGFRAVVGVATGGIAWAAWLGEQLYLPVGYVRPQPKAHGLTRQVEGLPGPLPVLLVEDLISTGESMRRAAAALQAEGYPVLVAAALWSYELPGVPPMDFPAHVLLTFPRALLYWRRAGWLSEQEATLLHRWHQTRELPAS